MTGDSDRFRGSNRFRDSGRIKMIMVWGLRIQLRNDTSHGHHLPNILCVGKCRLGSVWDVEVHIFM